LSKSQGAGGVVVFKVILYKQIHASFSGASSEDLILRKDLDLPFVPFQGLWIECRGYSVMVKGVTWDVVKQYFLCSTPPDEQRYHAGMHRLEGPPLEVIVKEYLESGFWERCGKWHEVLERDVEEEVKV